MEVLFFADRIGGTGFYHPAIQELLTHPPENVDYVKTYPKTNILTGVINRLYPIRPIAKIDNLNKFRDFDIIHADHTIVEDSVPYVYSTESMHMNYPYYKREIKKFLLAENLKRIIPWSQAGKDHLLKYIPELENKIDVVHPTVYPSDVTEKTNNEVLRILFISRRGYFIKGARELLKAYSNLKKNHKVEMTMVCNDVPDSEKIKNPDVEFLEPMPREQLKQLYEKSDVFVIPQYSDTYSMVSIEAMSFGLPVITTNIFANPEFVTGGKTGFLIDSINWFKMGQPRNFESICQKTDMSKTVSSLIEKIGLFLDDKKLLSTMSKNAIEEVTTGKLSYKIRNDKLKRIYKDVVA